MPRAVSRAVSYEGSKAQDCFEVGSVTSSSGAASAGGFVGRLAGTLTNCYATGTLQGNLDMYLNSEQGIVGTVRSYPSVLSCADLMNTPRGFPMFVSAQDISKPKMDILTIQQVVQEGTYTRWGWDFKDTWVLPSGGSYKLPMLRGVGETAQAALTMPTHLQ